MTQEETSGKYTLAKRTHSQRGSAPGPVVLVVMDGVGLGTGDEGDAVKQAHTPTLDRLIAEHPFRTLRAHGTAVGLPSDGDMGNSEVGHNALGAGQVVDQGAKLVNRAMKTGEAFETEGWSAVLKRAQAGGTLHLIGLVSDGNVHSHIRHVNALLERAAQDGVQSLRVHALTDGRDVGAQSALTWIDPLEEKLTALSDDVNGTYAIASGGGRMIMTMDRYQADWPMVERGWNAHVHGRAERTFARASEAIRTLRKEDPSVSDQYLPPFVCVDAQGQPIGTIQDGDAVIFFNFRGDRAIELCLAFEADDFPHFDRGVRPDALFLGMTRYDGDRGIPNTYLVPPPRIREPLGQWLTASNVRQFACSETQKFGHVTYFWNGNKSSPFSDTLEKWHEVPSDNVPFEQRPWMKAAEITDTILDAIASGEWDFIRVNYANGDMVGHTGDLLAAILSVETVDLCLARLLKAIDRVQGTLIVLADHGNADDMFERAKDGTPKRDAAGAIKPRTSHTLSPVPFIVYRPSAPVLLEEGRPEAGLGNVAATVAELLGFVPPERFLPSLLKES